MYTIETPALILDRSLLERNINRMARRAADLRVELRPHMKTTKSAEVAVRATKNQVGGITVSTLKEIEYFFSHGFRDFTYAVGIEVSKLPHIVRMQNNGARINLILDHPSTALQVVSAAEQLNTTLHILVEIDSGSHRGGLLPDDDALTSIVQILHLSPNIMFTGVLTHAGCSYNAKSVSEIAQFAEWERLAVVDAAARIEETGIKCPVRSVGSTPTAIFAKDLTGVTEFRPGVYMLMDLYQVGLGVCNQRDLAVSVLATVIGRRDDLGYVLIDAGALALSQDISAAKTYASDILYGQVRNHSGTRIYDTVRLDTVHQEHGWLRAIAGTTLPEDLVPGARVRIYPNHACMMAAPYSRYHVVDGVGGVADVWEKAAGW